MKCPQCNEEFKLSWKLYFKLPFWFHCPNCKIKLKGKKPWFYFPLAMFGICILGIPGSIKFGIYGWIIGGALSGIPFDRMLENKLLTLKIKNTKSNQNIEPIVTTPAE